MQFFCRDANRYGNGISAAPDKMAIPDRAENLHPPDPI
jgi:hypothetical protein